MGQSARIYRPGFRDKYDHVISWNKDLLSQVSWLWKKTSDFPLFNSCLYITIRYLENATLKLVKKWTVVIVAFGSHRLTQEPRWNLRGDSEFLDIVNNCRQELRLKNWQHIRIRPWQGIKYSFRSKAKVYYTPRNLIEGGGTEKIPASLKLSRSSCRSGSRQMAVCITCFLQETKSCATLKCMHLIKELNARNLILQTLLMLSDDYMWSKNVWIYQIQSTPTLILMNSTPENY